MGKFGQYQKRGSAALFGTMGPPIAGDFTIGTPLTTSVPVTRVAAIPAPATVAWYMVQLASSGGSYIQGQNAAASFSATGLLSGLGWQIRFAWGTATQRLSDWGPAIPFTTA